MIAKIVTSEKEYYSNVFAKFNQGFNETVIVFNNENEQFELIKVYDGSRSFKRKVFIIDTDMDGMVEKSIIKLSLINGFKNCFGYDWIINNVKLIKKIKANKKVDIKYIELAKKTNEKMEINEWKYVKNEKDAKDLLSAVSRFHDAIINNISYEVKEVYKDPKVVQVLFTGCWDCDILLEFQSDVLIHFSIDENNSYEIMDSNILFDDGYIYWVDDDIENIKEINDNYTYFRGRFLKWKSITKK